MMPPRYHLGDYDRAASLESFQSLNRRMSEVVALLRRLVDADSSLLLLGETGVGKEWFARAVHASSQRRNGPFIPVNCAGIPEGLLDSELFGHEAGAFTGALRGRRGLFELADGGVLFLDEIGEMPLHLQSKLLRVLQDHRIQRLGSECSLPINVRVLAATNCDLRDAVRKNRFREDLYYRIAVVNLTVPPLRDRKEDIPELASAYLVEYSARHERKVFGIRDDAMSRLVQYSWPGNVRELRITMERAVLLADGPWITAEHLPPIDLPGYMIGPGMQPLTGNGESESDASEIANGLVNGGHGPLRPLKDARAEMLALWEREYLTRCLSESRGRIEEAAELAAINPRSLRDMMRRHGLRKEHFRRRPR